MTKTYTYTDFIEEEYTYSLDGVTYKTNDPIYNALQQFTEDFAKYIEHIANMNEEEKKEWAEKVDQQYREYSTLKLIDEILAENEEVFEALVGEEKN